MDNKEIIAAATEGPFRAPNNTTVINRLPPEIVAECLHHSLPCIEDYSNASRCGTAIPTGPSTLSAVCNRWRDIACGTPILWTVIPVILIKDQDPRPMAYALQLWLARSGSVQPLSIIIDVARSSRRYWRSYQEGMKCIIAMINKQSHRLPFFKATGVYSWLNFIDFESHGARNLDRLEIINPKSNYLTAEESDTEDDDVSPDERHHSEAPERRIRIGPFSDPTILSLEFWTILQLGIGADRLTHAVLTYLASDGVLDVLTNASRLVSCSLSCCFLSRYPTLFDNTTIHHSSVQKLDIHSSAKAAGAIIQSLHTPRLDSFQIHEVMGPYFMPQFLALLHRSAPPLQVPHFAQVTARQNSVKRTIAAIIQSVAPTLRSFAFTLSVNCAPVDVMRTHELVDAVFGASGAGVAQSSEFGRERRNGDGQNGGCTRHSHHPITPARVTVAQTRQAPIPLLLINNYIPLLPASPYIQVPSSRLAGDLAHNECIKATTSSGILPRRS